jgi:hypothetical protein
MRGVLLFTHGGGVLQDGAALYFATKGLLMGAYGIKCHELDGLQNPDEE